MYYYYLSAIKDIVSEEQCDMLGDYFCMLTPNTRELITVSKIAKALQIEYSTAGAVLVRCEKAGFLKRKYGVVCPECDTLIKMIDLYEYENVYMQKTYECYGCDDSVKLDDDNIIVYFELVIDVSPFATGQRV